MYTSDSSLRKRDGHNHIDDLKETQNDNSQESNKPCTTELLSATVLNDYNRQECDRHYDTVKRETLHGKVNNRSTETNEMWHNELKINANSVSKQPCTSGNQNCWILWRMFIKSFQHKNWLSDVIDIILRAISVVVFAKLETANAFKRKIHMEELWLYQNPRMPDIVTPAELLLSVILVPWVATLLVYYITKDIRDFRAASWAWTLALCINGLTTSTLKVTFGRPRPDFFYRCFPDGVMVLNNITDPTGIADVFNCTGSVRDINEGRKSFPSGHASFAFTSFGFIAFYIGTKLHAFNVNGRGQTWRFCLTVAPLVVAALVAISRTCDYHHHWQDVVAGSIIGILSVHIAYRQYYPSIFDINADQPIKRFGATAAHNRRHANGDTFAYTSVPHLEESLDSADNDLDEPSALIDNKYI